MIFKFKIIFLYLFFILYYLHFNIKKATIIIDLSVVIIKVKSIFITIFIITIFTIISFREFIMIIKN
jgi:hypothetical protein